MTVSNRRPRQRALALLLSCAAAAGAKIPDNAIHPAYDLKTIPMPAMYKTMGMDFLPDGRLVFATGYVEDGKTTPGEESRVYVASGVTGDMANVQVNMVA